MNTELLKALTSAELASGESLAGTTLTLLHLEPCAYVAYMVERHPQALAACVARQIKKDLAEGADVPGTLHRLALVTTLNLID